MAIPLGSAGITKPDLRQRLNSLTPGARDAFLGDVIYDLIGQVNDVTAKYNLLLTHLDAAGATVTDLGTANVATYAPAKSAVLLPEDR